MFGLFSKKPVSVVKDLEAGYWPELIGQVYINVSIMICNLVPMLE